MKKLARKSVKLHRNPAIMTVVIPSAREGARIAATHKTSNAELVAFSNSLIDDAAKRAEEAFSRLALLTAR